MPPKRARRKMNEGTGPPDKSLVNEWNDEFASTGFAGCPKCSVIFSASHALSSHYAHCTGQPEAGGFTECRECGLLLAAGLSYVTHHRRYHLAAPVATVDDNIAEGGAFLSENDPKRRLRSLRTRRPSNFLPPEEDEDYSADLKPQIKPQPLALAKQKETSPKSAAKGKRQSPSRSAKRKPIAEEPDTPAAPVKCGKCEKEFTDSAQFERHSLSVHSGLARPEGESQEFTPSEVKERLKLVETQLGKYVCPVCYKAFVTTAGFELHTEVCGKSVDELHEICPLCSCSRRTGAAMRRHMETHHAPRSRRRRTKRQEIAEAILRRGLTEARTDVEDVEMKEPETELKNEDESEAEAEAEEDGESAGEGEETPPTKPRDRYRIQNMVQLVGSGGVRSEEDDEEEAVPGFDKEAYFRALRKAKSITCFGCGENFKSFEEFRRHTLFSHNGLIRATGFSQDFNKREHREALRETIAACKRLVCLLCKKKLHSLTAYYYHEKSCLLLTFEDSLQNRECPECKTSFRDLELHLKHVHGIASKLEPQDEHELDGRLTEADAGNVVLDAEDAEDDAEAEAELMDKLQTHPMFSIWHQKLLDEGFIPCPNFGCDVECASIPEIYKHRRHCTARSYTPEFKCKNCSYVAHDMESMMAHAKQHWLFKRRSNPSSSPKRAPAMRVVQGWSPGQSLSKSLLGAADSVDKRAVYSGPDIWLVNMTHTGEARRRRGWSDLKNVDLEAEGRRGGEPFVVLDEEKATPYFPITKTSVQFCSAVPAKAEMPDVTKLAGLVDKVAPVQLERFRGTLDSNGVPIFFSGGPVQALEWCPMPDEADGEEGGLEAPFQTRQFMAVASLRIMNADLELASSPSEKALVQIWEIDAACTEEPKMRLGLCFDQGPIWDLKWMPSGGCAPTEEKSKAAWGKNWNKKDRLGVLAVACNDGCIRVVSIPRRVLPPKASCDPVFAHFTPNVTLRLFSRVGIGLFDDAANESTHAGKIISIDWSLDEAHAWIVAGLSSGLIALWNVTSRDPILCSREHGDDGSLELLPVKIFRGHTDYVSSVRFYPGTGMRHVASTSADRTLKLWDVFEGGAPQPLHQRQITNWPEEVAWLGNYPLLATAEQTMGNSHGGSYVMILGGNQEVQQRLTVSSSTGAWSLSFSPWFSAVVAQVVPDTVLSFIKPTLTKLEDDKIFRKRKYLLTRTVALPKKSAGGGAPAPDATWARTYERAAEHLKLCYFDMPVRSESFWRQWHGFSAPDDPTPPGAVPLATTRRIAWNTNLAFCTAIGSGGQSGLCRILVLKGFDNENFRRVKADLLARAGQDQDGLGDEDAQQGSRDAEVAPGAETEA